jgi:drug/metabolite transporter (DMT)-like permease
VAWFFAALIAAIFASAVNIIDSHLVSKQMPKLTSYLIPMGFTQLAGGMVILALFPPQTNPGWVHLLAGFGAGLLNSSGFLIILNALRKNEVSRVIPVISISPIFVALLSIPLLGETLGYWQWLAIIITVGGAVLISLQFNHGEGKARLQKSFFLLLLVALISAIASIGFKFALEKMTFWNMFSINGTCTAIVVLTYALRKENIEELKNLKQRTKKILFVAGDQCLGIAAGILAFKAMGIGPVALVSVILNARPAFVFIFSLLLGFFFPRFINDRLNKRTALIKFCAIALMTAGVAIISISK